MQPDNELLRQYASTGSESAFAELVKRHVNLVYSAAVRQVGGDAHLAHDVAQSVFTDLARKAASLCRRESLTGWLYTSAYFTASKMVRSEIRRRKREEQFMRGPAPDNASDSDWEQLRPIIDAAMHGLKDSEREAVLLRYFENRPYAEVGAKIGLNENAARKRVERALEKLRGLLAKRAITTTSALASIISANAIQVAPPTLAATLTNASLATAGAGTAFWNIMAATKLQIGLGALIVAGAVTAIVLQQAQHKLRAQNRSLAQELAQLKTDNADLSNQISAASNSQSPSNDQQAELLRLRAEVTRLRTTKNQLVTKTLPATNDAPEVKKTQITLKVRFVSVPAEQMQAFGLGWAPVGNGASLLSKEQLDRVLKALKQRDVQLIGEPQIITLSGREALASVTQSVTVNGTNANIGEIVDLVPYFSSDSSTITLNLMAQLNQLTGDPSRPGMRMLQTSNEVHLFPGQTTVMERDIPAGGWLPDSPIVTDGSTKLLVFVTPTLIDEVGNIISSFAQ